jgi:hypothetical protein
VDFNFFFKFIITYLQILRVREQVFPCEVRVSGKQDGDRTPAGLVEAHGGLHSEPSQLDCSGKVRVQPGVSPEHARAPRQALQH